MYYYARHCGHYPPNNPQRIKPGSIKRRSHPPQQPQQKQDFDDDPQPDLRKPSPSSVKDVISLLTLVVILIIAISGAIYVAAALLAVHMGGPKLLDLALQFLRQRPL